jgi:hypothetical protein
MKNLEIKDLTRKQSYSQLTFPFNFGKMKQ